MKQNWLGFSLAGNKGSGLGEKFAFALRDNLQSVFSDFGAERISRSSHIEKVCLISDGVGRDNISDFTLNLILDYICNYTQKFALEYIAPQWRRIVWLGKTEFDYSLKAWTRKRYELPYIDGDYVLLTPKDILTRDENWINRGDMVKQFEEIPVAIPDAELRGQVFAYFDSVLAKHEDRHASQEERAEAVIKTYMNFPELLDWYIRYKEDNGNKATDISAEKVALTKFIFQHQVKQIQSQLANETEFYSLTNSTYEETHQRLAFFKNVIEAKGGHRIFWRGKEAITRESDLQILCKFIWFGTPSDASAEVNDGRGPVDFKISRGALDKTLIEMKLAKNTKLRQNLEKQLPIYMAASAARRGIKVTIYFTAAEKIKTDAILSDVGILGHKDIVLIDGRNDNKPSGSKA
ncbi:hypothetical protein [Methylobacterium gnaphalii]|uniref:Uncharacterized protein n=1 Tax=Methylobacterium gnaphalii TaxID=1010610 RepID=A0A512JH09_9HYPH|nr:hypothetical protein [Methylobacterium gnaphalii]GEP09216.1 hypothetical protein MGN01_10610 [Methylobacterium gnaphalii]GJD67628.1 hypothetical protein MMMDOFMJ_0544 [Methylobacterium gnaphalii]GLS50539.1 hypothetical protein GCM10007885_33910 [Methylobacterium gnaphalii]